VDGGGERSAIWDQASPPPPALPCFLLPREKRIEGLVWGRKIAHVSWGGWVGAGVGLNANDSSASFSFRAWVGGLGTKAADPLHSWSCIVCPIGCILALRVCPIPIFDRSDVEKVKVSSIMTCVGARYHSWDMVSWEPPAPLSYAIRYTKFDYWYPAASITAWAGKNKNAPGPAIRYASILHGRLQAPTLFPPKHHGALEDRTPLSPKDSLMGIIAAFFFHFQRTILEILADTKLRFSPRGIAGYSQRFLQSKNNPRCSSWPGKRSGNRLSVRGLIETKHRISSHKVSRHILWHVTQSNPTGGPELASTTATFMGPESIF